MEYKVDDWVIFEFKISQIMEVEDGRPREVSDGAGRTSGWDFSDRIFPLTMRNKAISDSFEFYYDKLHREYYTPSLNYPDIHRKFVELWVKALSAPEGKEGDAIDEMRSFYKDITDAIDDLKYKRTNDVRIFGRR